MKAVKGKVRRHCSKCGSDKTYLNHGKYPCWYHDKESNTICKRCYLHVRYHNNSDYRERILYNSKVRHYEYREEYLHYNKVWHYEHRDEHLNAMKAWHLEHPDYDKVKW